MEEAIGNALMKLGVNPLWVVALGGVVLLFLLFPQLLKTRREWLELKLCDRAQSNEKTRLEIIRLHYEIIKLKQELDDGFAADVIEEVSEGLATNSIEEASAEARVASETVINAADRPAHVPDGQTPLEAAWRHPGTRRKLWSTVERLAKPYPRLAWWFLAIAAVLLGVLALPVALMWSMAVTYLVFVPGEGGLDATMAAFYSFFLIPLVFALVRTTSQHRLLVRRTAERTAE